MGIMEKIEEQRNKWRAEEREIELVIKEFSDALYEQSGHRVKLELSVLGETEHYRAANPNYWRAVLVFLFNRLEKGETLRYETARWKICSYVKPNGAGWPIILEKGTNTPQFCKNAEELRDALIRVMSDPDVTQLYAATLKIAVDKWRD